MKYILIFATFLMSTYAFSQTLSIAGSKYRVQKIGNKYLVVPMNSKLNVTESFDGDHPRVSKIDCDYAQRMVKRLKGRIEKCQENLNSTSCKYAKSRISEFSKEIINLNEVPESYFLVDHQLETDQTIKSMIAQRIGVKLNSILLLNEISSNYEIASISVKHSIDSLMSKVSSLGLFTGKEIYSYHYNQYIQTTNRLLYCDLKSGASKVIVNIVSTFSDTQTVPKKTKTTALNVYKKLKNHKINPSNLKLIQAANLGFVIGKELDNNEAKKSGVTIKSVFNKMIDTSQRDLELKAFRNDYDFMESLYPDKTYSVDLDQAFEMNIK